MSAEEKRVEHVAQGGPQPEGVPPSAKARKQGKALPSGCHCAGGTLPRRDQDADAGLPYVSRRKASLLARLRRIEGQVRGLQRMVEEDAYCPDILTQVAAARAAIDGVGLLLLEDHTRGCVATALRESDGEDDRADAMISEVVGIVKRFLR